MQTKIRGIIDDFMQVFFFLDVVMTDFLAYYFIEYDYSQDGDKRKEFSKIFLNDEKFARKSEILIKIINNKYPQFIDILSAENFKSIKDLRNAIAHSVVEFEVDSIDNSQSRIRIRKFRKGELESEELSYNHISETNSICIKIFKILNLELKKIREFSFTREAYFRAMSESYKSQNPK